uniref:ascorbate ferrireductase (transmembrane) n=1 Tax=Plectus sambesii TaxID=2011161 RepID=A0A914WBZ7_9BILA
METPDEATERLRKTHGSLMIIAWFLFHTTAIISARYFRRHWLDKRVFGLNIWFLLHRTLSYLGVLLILGGLICILVSRSWTWSGPGAHHYDYDRYFTSGAIHSIFGLVCIVICWGQPIAALFRCSSSSSRRPIYNWFHRIAGISAWLLAVIAISIAAADFPYFSNNSFALALVIIFVVCLSIAVVIGEVSAALERRHAFQTTKENVSQRRYTSFSESTYEMKMQKIRTITFGLFTLVSIDARVYARLSNIQLSPPPGARAAGSPSLLSRPEMARQSEPPAAGLYTKVPLSFLSLSLAREAVPRTGRLLAWGATSVLTAKRAAGPSVY